MQSLFQVQKYLFQTPFLIFVFAETFTIYQNVKLTFVDTQAQKSNNTTTIMSASLCKIHVNNSTGVSLNERFTAMTTRPKVTVGRRSRSRSLERPMQRAEPATTRANQRFLAELQRKHKVQAALKLKRVCVLKRIYYKK